MALTAAVRAHARRRWTPNYVVPTSELTPSRLVVIASSQVPDRDPPSNTPCEQSPRCRRREYAYTEIQIALLARRNAKEASMPSARTQTVPVPDGD